MISVLYVDDEPGLLEIAQMFLEERGEFRVQTAISAKEVLDSPQIMTYDAIISDYQMPGMDGIAFLKVVRERFGDIPFILFTGRGREEVAIAAINNGADSYIQKGGDPEAQFAELAHKIRQAVRRKHAERSLQDSERRLSDIIDFLPDATFAIDRSGHVIAWNRAIEEMTGVPAGEMLGKGDHAYAVPFYGEPRPMLLDLIDEPKEKISEYYTNVYRSGSSLTAETDYTHPKGHQIIVLAKACHLYNQAGEITGAIESIRDITEKKLVEEERAFNNAILSTQQETSLDAILIVDENGRIVNYNRQFIALWGVSEDLVKQGPDEPVLQFVSRHLADPVAFLYRVKYLYRHKEEKSFEELLLKDGRVLERFSAPMLGETGKYYGRVWYFRDITGRKRIEKELRESEERLRLFIQHAPAALAMFDRDMRYIAASRRWMADYHLGDRDITGHSHYEIFPEISEDLKAIHRRALAGEVLSGNEDKFEREDGSVQWLSWEVRPWYTAGGIVAGIIIFSEDITERKKAETALRASEQRFRNLIQNSSDMIRIIGRDGLIAYSSPSTLRLFGYNPEEVIGKDPLDFIHPDDRVLVKNELWDVFGEINSGVPTEYRIRHRDGHYIDVEAIASSQLDTPGINGIVVTTRPITERKKNEASLRESENWFATVFRDSPVALTLVSATDGKFTDVNDAFIRGSGYSREEVIGKTAAEVGIFADRDEFGQLAAAMRSHHTVQGLEMKVRRKTGEIRTCRFSSGIILMDGRPFILSSVEDVTDYKAAEEALRRSEEKYRFLTENSLDIIYSMDLEGTITHISPQVTRYGYTPGQLIGHNISEVIDKEDLPRIREDIRITVETERSTRTVFRLKDRPENPVWFEDNGAVIKKADGVAVGVSGVLRDITERMKAEAALEKSEAWLYRLAEHSPDMIYRMSLPDGKYEYMSPAVEEMTGYTPEEFYADPGLIRRLIHPAWQEYFRKEWQALLENRAPPFYEFQIIDRAGNTRWLNQRNALVTNDQGKPVAIEGIVTDVTRQKTTELELRRSELRSLAVSENAGEWIWEVDAAGVYRYSSPAVWKILGYRPEDLVGKMHYYDLFDPLVREELKTRTSAGFESREPFRDFVNLNRHRNGTPVILSTSATPVFDETGAFTGYCGVDEDITEKQRAQEELRESRRMLAEAMDLAHLVNWEYDVDTDMFTFDDRFYALYGTSAEREGGTRMSSGTYAREFVHPDDRWMVAAEVKKAMETPDPGYISHADHRIIRRDGEIRYITVRVAIAKDEKGRTVKTHGANQDITERRRAEVALRENEEKYRSLVETSPDIIWETDLQGRFRYISPMVRSVLGYDPEEVIGNQIMILVPEQKRPAMQKEFMRILGAEAPLMPFEVPARHRDGRDMIIEIRPARITGPDGNLIGLRGVAHDITRRKKTEEALRVMNRQLKLLSGITRHDILNKISVILGYLKIAGKKCKDPVLLDYLIKLETATGAIRSQIEFTRVYENLGTQEPQWIFLDAILPRTHVPASVTLDADVQGILVFADPMLEKVFFNLLDNSLRHGERVTTIRVSYHRDGPELVITWEDDGVGIASDEKERIFERGYGKNTGLGLFLVREILSLTGITITETGEPGAGARFEMVVPDGAYRGAPE